MAKLDYERRGQKDLDGFRAERIRTHATSIGIPERDAFLGLDEPKAFIELKFRPVTGTILQSLRVNWKTELAKDTVYAPLYTLKNYKKKPIGFWVIITSAKQSLKQSWITAVAHSNGKMYRVDGQYLIQTSEKSWRDALDHLMAMRFWPIGQNKYQSWFDRYQIRIHAPTLE